MLKKFEEFLQTGKMEKKKEEKREEKGKEETVERESKKMKHEEKNSEVEQVSELIKNSILKNCEEGNFPVQVKEQLVKIPVTQNTIPSKITNFGHFSCPVANLILKSIKKTNPSVEISVEQISEKIARNVDASNSPFKFESSKNGFFF